MIRTDRNLTTVLAITLAACASADTPPPVSVTPAVWELPESAHVSIGTVGGDERYQFTRITGILLLNQGRILVAEGSRLTLYDSAGTFVGRWGRKGDGPGEFNWITRPPFRMRGDSVGVWDFGANRLTVFSSDGRYGRTIEVARPSRIYWSKGSIPASDCCHIEHVLSNGNLILAYPPMIPTEPGPPRHATVTLTQHASDGAFMDSIGAFQDGQYVSDPKAPNGARSFRLTGRFTYTTIGDTIFGGNGENNLLVRVVPGSPPDTIKLPGAPVPFNDAMKQTFAQAYRDEYARNPRIFEGPIESFYEGEYAANVPAFWNIQGDDEGHIWITPWAMPFSKVATTYQVHSTRGEHVASVTMPSSMFLRDVSRGRVAVVVYDSLDVPQVRVYRLKR